MKGQKLKRFGQQRNAVEGWLTPVVRSSLLSHNDHDGSGMTPASVLLWRPHREGRWPGGRVLDRKCCVTQRQARSCATELPSNIINNHIHIFFFR